MADDTTAQERVGARSIKTLGSAPAKAGRHFNPSFPVAMTVICPALLGIVNLRHWIGYEEGQARPITRDSNSIANLFYNITLRGPSLALVSSSLSARTR